MTWLVLAVLVVAFVLRRALRRRTHEMVAPSTPISTIQVASRQTARKKAALKAATGALR